MGKLLIYAVLFSAFIAGIILIPKYNSFKGSDYENSSGNGFLKTLLDKGNYGEFLTFLYLEKIDSFNRLLTNVYIPKDDGSTSEVDLIMISPTGIYVFESKNYSGWIFGSEKSKNWTQTLESKQKYKFFNPIWQNKGHMTALKDYLKINNSEIFKSYIVFSERCELKKIELDSKDIKVIKRNDLLKTIEKDIKSSDSIITVNDVIGIYSKLKKHSNVDESVKRAHIESTKTMGKN